MKVKFHCNMFTTVQRTGQNDLFAQTHLVDTVMDASATIRTAIDNLEIKEARWDIYRSPGGKLNGGGELSGLHGVKAYIDAGPALRDATETLGSTPRYILTDCIAGIVLGEVATLPERGYANLDELESFWRKNQSMSCHRFAQVERSTQTWAEYVEGARSWNNYLFNRFKTATIYGDDNGKIEVRGTLVDYYHELSITAVVVNGILEKCTGQFLRYPDSICLECMTRLDDLNGKSLNHLTKKELGRYIGGPQGCSHMLDVLDHIKRAITQANKYADLVIMEK